MKGWRCLALGKSREAMEWFKNAQVRLNLYTLESYAPTSLVGTGYNVVGDTDSIYSFMIVDEFFKVDLEADF
jgi:hypothetical protein